LYSREVFNKEYDRLLQINLADEYLELCTRYSTPIKSMRSHLFKYLHRYFCLHSDIRLEITASKSAEEMQLILIKLREMILSTDDLYEDSWYKRHRNPSYLHAGRMGSIASDNKKNITRAYDDNIECGSDFDCNVFGCLDLYGDN
jgi:hypothetical protein